MSEGHLEELANAVNGSVLVPGDENYDPARALWNARFDRRPDVVVQCEGADDVQASVNFARTRNLPLSVKGGGHAFAANTVGDGGLLIDLSPMKGIEIDPEAKIARIEAGLKWGEFDPLAQAHGLASPGGTVSGVGVAGYTLGGGAGYLARKHGMAIDNLLSVDVVTAGGDFLHASADENTDLFWALRGGGGNFGVATRFEFQLHEVGPEVVAGQVFHRLEDAPDLLRFYRDFMAAAPDDIQCYPFFLRVPPMELFPEAYHGQLALDFVVFHAGSGAEAEAALRPLVERGRPFLSLVGPQPYVSVLQTFDAGLPSGQRYDSRSHDLPAITDATIDTLMEHLPGMSGDFSSAYLGGLGGAVGQVDPTATAFPHRDARFSFHIMAGWSEAEQDEEVMRWVQGFHDAMASHATGGVYVNVLGTNEEARVRAAYGSNYNRLVELKKKWDPDNLFRRNHNIPPTG
jgi:FAD/FMN-containing dehydrogenase